jgi:hypothetical protein
VCAFECVYKCGEMRGREARVRVWVWMGEESGRRGRKERRGEVVYKGKVSSEREMDREKTRGTTLLKFLCSKIMYNTSSHLTSRGRK